VLGFPPGAASTDASTEPRRWDEPADFSADSFIIVTAAKECQRTARQFAAKRRLPQQAQASGRERVGIVGEQEVSTVLDRNALGTNSGCDDRAAMRKGLKDLNARAAAGAQRHDGHIGFLIKRRQVFNRTLRVCRTIG
jgi:hypothetical protein